MTDKREKVIPPLTSIYMYASGACNLNCSHCWINPEFHEPGTQANLHITPSLVQKAIEQGKPLGLRTIKLTGGEPFMNPWIEEIIEAISSDGIGIHIETNGTLITAGLAAKLADTATFRFISVSIDGASSETHEALRRVKGSFDNAMRGIRHLVEAGIKPQVICTLHRDNFGQITDIVHLAEDSGCGSVKFNNVQPSGRGKDFDSSLTLSIKEIIELSNLIDEEVSPSSSIRVLPDIPFAFQKPARFLNGSIGRCTIHGILGLLSNGDMALCGIGTSVPELVFGNINTDSIADIWRNSPKLAELRRLIPDELNGICSQCIHRHLCNGYCVAGNYNLTGNLNAPYYFCSEADKLGLFPESRKL